jgi:hypothetical protein
MHRFSRLLFVLSLLAFNAANAQSDNLEMRGYLRKVPLSDIKSGYLEVHLASKGENPPFSNLAAGLIAFDGINGSEEEHFNLITRERGEQLRLNFYMGFINFMSFNGWEFIGKTNDLLPAESRTPKGSLFFRKIK